MTTIKTEGLEELTRSLEGFPRIYQSVVVRNLGVLGGRIRYFCQQEVRDIRYTGRLENSFISTVDGAKHEVRVWPTAGHAIFVRLGTRPHWAPIGPLKAWARVKLGDENLAYPVQRSIAKHGTSMWHKRKRGTKANPWPLRVVARGDFRTALDATANRIGKDLAAMVVQGV